MDRKFVDGRDRYEVVAAFEIFIKLGMTMNLGSAGFGCLLCLFW